jgi:hypothetical protein
VLTMGDYYNEGNVSVPCASWAPIVGFMGCAFAVVFASECQNKRLVGVAQGAAMRHAMGRWDRRDS